jgi:hypothetical protein
MLYLILIGTLSGAAGEDRTTRYVTTNFIVEAPTKEVAHTIGKQAEAERERLASLWLEQAAPAWEERCLIRVKAGKGKATGATTFQYDERRLYSPKQEIQLEGPAADLLRDVVPQQVTHTLLAHDLGAAYPRWVQTGTGMLEQGEHERQQQFRVLRQALAGSKVMKLAQLFELREFLSDWQTMYAQSFSVTQFLVDRKDRATYLAFVQRGMQRGWDHAVQRYYGFDDVADLEAAWLKSLKQLK